MQPRNWPIGLYILFILCMVTVVNTARDIVDYNGNITNSTATVKTTATYLGHFVKEFNQSEATLASTSMQNTIGNSTTTVSSGSTVAMPTAVLNSSQISVTPTGSVQTTTPSNVSSYSAPESPATPTLNLTATVSQVTTKVTSAPKPTQEESPVTSRESSSSDVVTKPTTGSLYSIITTTTSGLVSPLKKEEVILTICLSTILGVVILTVVMYNVNKCKRRRAQYSHHPLYSNSQEDPGFPNDTLVISGGLYDESRVYNPNMTILEEDDELHVEYPAFASKYSQFKLEFLPEERETTGQASSFTTFQPET